MSTLTVVPPTYDLEIYRGDSLEFDFVPHLSGDVDGTPTYAFPNGTLAFTSSIKDVNGLSKGAFAVTKSTATKINMKLTPATTAALAPGVTYYYDLQMSSNSGADVFTFVKGTIIVTGDIS
jgi:hypothetical protein